MLPLSLLRAAVGHPMFVELKNGETFNGHLVSCDAWMNININQVICTSRNGDKFWEIPECYIRGNTIKYLRIPPEVIAKVQEEEKDQKDKFNKKGNQKGGRGGRGRGMGGGRGAGRGTGRGRGGRK
uniref:U6 snRNA-associated Sm-like protein LSm4 n=1 Tax=Paramoeba aestuarina TaxID=180227 RepID=A0A7S4KQV1_9EUKA|mmetsp:Transcript_23582/g.36780  ORF Transcript_23582/g.36780 Transcript_23582/m.36780 type:complete len:126 (+) Transcript_23582:50-427(+)